MLKLNRFLALILIFISLAAAANLWQTKLTLANQSVSSPISSPVTPSPTSQPISAPITTPEPEPTPNPTQAPSQPSQPSNPGSGSSGGGSAPSCSDTKPTSAPKLISALSRKPNQVTLTWTKANDPVTYYLVAYGTNSVANQFGNPNVGGSLVTSYIVEGLSGNVLYYFRVRAGNGCTPGQFSNVLSVRANGRSISRPAVGFQPGVLAAKAVQKSNPQITPKAVSTSLPTPVAAPNNSILQKVVSFFSNIFSR